MSGQESNPTYPEVSFVIATHNRRDTLLHTLRKLHELSLPKGSFEIIVVDNASNDGTADAARTLADVILRRSTNKGSCAKAWGTDAAKGRIIVFLDDDSYPRPGSIERMTEIFADEPQLAAVGFVVHLPDGRRESSALPGVSVGCGAAYRASALLEVGGLDRTFFMQAEEYDLAFKLVTAGWRVCVRSDLHVEHLKTSVARQSSRTCYFDVRNNLRIIARHLSPLAAPIYREDWLLRYQWIAQRDENESAFRRGRRSGLLRGTLDRLTHRRSFLSSDGFEFFFRWSELESRFRGLRGIGIRKLVGIDLGKNIYAFHRAAERSGITLAAIADDRFAWPGREYRGIPIVPFEAGLETPCDAFVVCNMASAHAETSKMRSESKTSRPVYGWYGSPTSEQGECPNTRFNSISTSRIMDSEVIGAVVR